MSFGEGEGCDKNSLLDRRLRGCKVLARNPWIMMVLVRTIFTIIIAASLAALPARVGAIGSFGSSTPIISVTANCASTDDSSCQSASGTPEYASDEHVSDMAPISDECDRSGDRRTMAPGACYTYCNNLSALPAIVAAGIDIVFVVTVRPAAGPVMDGIGVSPEPPPPKLV